MNAKVVFGPVAHPDPIQPDVQAQDCQQRKRHIKVYVRPCMPMDSQKILGGLGPLPDGMTKARSNPVTARVHTPTNSSASVRYFQSFFFMWAYPCTSVTGCRKSRRILVPPAQEGVSGVRKIWIAPCGNDKDTASSLATRSQGVPAWVASVENHPSGAASGTCRHDFFRIRFEDDLTDK